MLALDVFCGLCIVHCEVSVILVKHTSTIDLSSFVGVKNIK